MSYESSCAVILAAGEGKRMRSNRAKALSPVLFKPMLEWVIDSVCEAGIRSVCVVTGSRHEQVEEFLDEKDTSIVRVFQEERRGTGHAVMTADAFLRAHQGASVLVLNGDAPFVSAQVISDALRSHEETGNAVTVITAVLDDPSGYGRVVRDRKTQLIRAIVEQKDATPEVLAIREINSGAYWFRVDDLLAILYSIQNDNAQGEYYLTDAVKLLIQTGKKAVAYTADDPSAVLGANDCVQLNALNAIARERILRTLMESGVEIPCRDGVLVGPDVEVGGGTCILPGAILRGHTRVGAGCVVGPNTILTDCTVGDGAVLNSVQCTRRVIAAGESVPPYTVL